MGAIRTRYLAPTIPICTLHWTLTYLGTSMYIGPHTCMSGYVSAYHGVGKLCILLHTILCHAVWGVAVTAQECYSQHPLSVASTLYRVLTNTVQKVCYTTLYIIAIYLNIRSNISCLRIEHNKQMLILQYSQSCVVCGILANL